MDNDKTILGKMETIKHIQSVRSFLYLMIEELDTRARNHDQSKLESPEAEIFGEYTHHAQENKQNHRQQFHNLSKQLNNFHSSFLTLYITMMELHISRRKNHFAQKNQVPLHDDLHGQTTMNHASKIYA